MSDAQRIVAILIPAAYLLGSIPFGLIVGLAKGIDPRRSGSGNIGATNLGRLLGGKYFALVFALDLLKGMLPMLAASFVLRDEASEMARALTTTDYLLWLGVGMAAILGHMFSAFLRLRGGKGVATSAGVMLGLYPYFTGPGLVAIGGFLVLVLFTRYISVGSMGGAVIFPLAYVLVGRARGWDVFGAQLPLLIFGVLVALLIIYKHRTNIARLIAGTENKLVKKTLRTDEPVTPPAA
jgi:acyl phosphate:glycerol-3-phosphate acyltransferase